MSYLNSSTLARRILVRVQEALHGQAKRSYMNQLLHQERDGRALSELRQEMNHAVSVCQV